MKSIERIVPFELDGTTYYLNYSVRASQALLRLAKEKGYEDLSGFLGESDSEKSITNTALAAEVLIREGARYRELVEKEKAAPTIEAEQLELVCSIPQFNDLAGSVAKAFMAGSTREVDAAPKKQKATKAPR